MKKVLLPFTVLALLLLLVVVPYLRQPQALINLRNEHYTYPKELAKLQKYFQRHHLYYERDPPLLPVVYVDEYGDKPDYKIQLANETLGLSKSQITLQNPFAEAPFPLSFSILYQGNLVVLFEPGYFACYHLDGLTRNLALEKQLNTRRFQYHWLIDNELIGLSGKTRYVFTKQGRWEAYTKLVPFGKRSKLFEDARFIVCMKCLGEWGGEAYFYDKQKQQYYLTEATCPNTIIKKNGKYLIVSSLAHMLGFAQVQQIDNPAELTRWVGKTVPQARDFEHDGTLTSSHGTNVFNYQGLLLFSGFELDGQLIYMVHWRDRTFLATWQDNTFSIVDPLFNNNLDTDEPITTAYSADLVLVNFDSYNLAAEKEVSCLLLSGKKLLKINWSKESKSVLNSPAIEPPTKVEKVVDFNDSTGG